MIYVLDFQLLISHYSLDILWTQYMPFCYILEKKC